MELQTISQVYKIFKILTRTLRYYELIEFVEESELLKYKPDAKVYGFNNPGEPDSE